MIKNLPAIVLFDGVCNLCCSTVQFIIRHDPKQQFRFAQLQSNVGKALLTKHQLASTARNSFILLMDEHVYTQSTAALHVAKKNVGGMAFVIWLYHPPDIY